MKVTVSMPEPLFRGAERAAKRQKISRNRFYSIAVQEYLERRQSKAITEALNKVYSTESSELDPVLARLQSKAIGPGGW